MARLLNPGIGDICDRLTILALKILHTPPDRSSEHFVNERNGLLTKVRASTLNGSWFEHVLSLGAVNAMLWQRTDEMRKYAECRAEYAAHLTAVADCGLSILTLNDERARLVGLINELTGDPFVEKL